ncbi:MAG: helix-turn-helix transcriptional regulator [Pseudobacteriovorax sp.]|nr:helix-turn-helix transcriptional regulator [Pseudobacteriovorax sp.]
MSNRVLIDRKEIESLIAQSGLKKQEIAKKLGIAKETLSRWTSGKTLSMPRKKFDQLMLILSNNERQFDNARLIAGSEVSSLDTQKALQNPTALITTEQITLGILLEQDNLDQFEVTRISGSQSHWFLQAAQQLLGKGDLRFAKGQKFAQSNFNDSAKALTLECMLNLYEGKLEDLETRCAKAMLLAQEDWVSTLILYLSSVIALKMGKTDLALASAKKSLSYCDHLDWQLKTPLSINIRALMVLISLGDATSVVCQGHMDRFTTAVGANSKPLFLMRKYALETFLEIKVKDRVDTNIAVKLEQVRDYYLELPEIYKFELIYLVQIFKDKFETELLDHLSFSNFTTGTVNG